MGIPRNRELLPYAKKLRRNMTPQEQKLWYMFIRKYPVKIYRQRTIGNYIVDFYCYSAKLVIEVDGAHHYKYPQRAYDARRTRFLESYGLLVIRFSNREVDTQFETVCEKIHQTIQGRLKWQF